MGGSRFLLDTNAVIALQRDNADLKAVLQDASEVFIPIIVVGELYFGAYKSQLVENNRRAVADFVADRVVLRIDIDTAAAYGQVKQALRAKGRPIPKNDIWIAALARQHELTLITDDGHFAEVEGLVTKNW